MNQQKHFWWQKFLPYPSFVGFLLLKIALRRYSKFQRPPSWIMRKALLTNDLWRLLAPNFGTFLRWWFGPHTWIFNSKFSSRIRDFGIQNPVSGKQNFKEQIFLENPWLCNPKSSLWNTEFQGGLGFTVHERKTVKLGGRGCKSFLIHAMSYISNLFSALCQSAFFIAWQSGHGFSLVVLVNSCYVLSNYQVDRSSAMWVRRIHLRMDVTKTHLQNHSCGQKHRLCADLSKW